MLMLTKIDSHKGVAHNNYLSFYQGISEAIGTVSLAAVGLFIILQRRSDAQS